MDDADRAEEHMERELDMAIRAARGIPGYRFVPLRSHCPDCGYTLEAHRRAYGVCRPCQELREARGRWR